MWLLEKFIFAVTNQNNRILIAYGCNGGSVLIYGLGNNYCIDSPSNRDYELVREYEYDEVEGGRNHVEFIRQGSRLCLLYLFEIGPVYCWNIANRSITSSTFYRVLGCSLLTCGIGGELCIVTGGMRLKIVGRR